VTIHRSSWWPGFDAGCSPSSDDLVEAPDTMRALKPEVVDAVRAAVEPLLLHRIGPIPSVATGLGSRTGSASGGILVRLVTGSSWVDIEAILDRQVSDTTLRARRDEWIAAGVFDHLKAEAMAAFDRKKASQNARASWIDPQRPWNSGKYFRVLKLASL
jgi:hypothetical protein